jgi:hypothetical protein
LQADGGKGVVAPEVDAVIAPIPLSDDGVVLQRGAGEAVEVEAFDV